MCKFNKLAQHICNILLHFATFCYILHRQTVQSTKANGNYIAVYQHLTRAFINISANTVQIPAGSQKTALDIVLTRFFLGTCTTFAQPTRKTATSLLQDSDFSATLQALFPEVIPHLRSAVPILVLKPEHNGKVYDQLVGLIRHVFLGGLAEVVIGGVQRNIEVPLIIGGRNL